MSADAGVRRPVAALLVANIGVAVAGLLSASATAWVFGVGREAAVFFAAWSLVSVVERVFQAGQIAELAIPAYHRDIAELGEAEAKRRFAVLINIAMLFVAAAAGLLSFLAQVIGGALLPGLSPADRELALAVLAATVPMLPLIVLGGLLQSLGNARGLYGRFESWLAVGSLSGSATVLCLGDRLGIWALVASSWVVQIVSILGRVRQLRRDGYRHHWSPSLPGYSPWSLLRELGFTSLYVGATQVYLLGFNAALTFLPTSAYAAFRYGDQLFTRTSSLFLRPISTVFYTEYSKRLANGASDARDILRASLSHFADMWAIYSTLLLLASYPLLALAWGSENFGPTEVESASLVFAIQVAAVLFRASGALFRKHNLAHGAVRQQYLGNVVTQLISAALAPFLVVSFGFGGAVAMLVANMVMMSVSDALVSRLHGANPLGIIPWGRIAAWMALVGCSVFTARGLVDLPMSDVLDAGHKVRLALASAGQLGIAAAVLFMGALWIGHGNLLYLSGLRRLP